MYAVGVPSELTAFSWRLPRYKQVKGGSEVSDSFLPSCVALTEAPALQTHVLLHDVQSSRS